MPAWQMQDGASNCRGSLVPSFPCPWDHPSPSAHRTPFTPRLRVHPECLSKGKGLNSWSHTSAWNSASAAKVLGSSAGHPPPKKTMHAGLFDSHMCPLQKWQGKDDKGMRDRPGRSHYCSNGVRQWMPTCNENSVSPVWNERPTLQRYGHANEDLLHGAIRLTLIDQDRTSKDGAMGVAPLLWMTLSVNKSVAALGGCSCH